MFIVALKIPLASIPGWEKKFLSSADKKEFIIFFGIASYGIKSLFSIEYSDISSTDFARNTVQEVYDFIIDDIEMALSFLPRTVKDRNRVSAAAAEALYGKVLMFQHRFDEALVHLDLALDYTANTQVELGIYDYNEEFLDGGVFTPASPFFGPATVNRNLNKEVLYDKGFVNSWSFVQNEFVINPETASLFNYL